NGGAPFLGTNTLDYAAKIEWFGTARLRAGYLFGDGTVLTYVTGGGGGGKGGVAGPGPTPPPQHRLRPIPHVTQPPRRVNLNTGWVVGSGTEGKLVNFPGWTYRIEGFYMDLGHLDATGPGGSVGSLSTTGFVLTAGPAHTNTHFTDTILRAGLSYQFH